MAISERKQPDNPAELKPVTLHESWFWSKDDPRWPFMEKGKRASDFQPPKLEKVHEEGSYEIDMGTDSYIWCFTGKRGGGKTTAMTYFAIQAVWNLGLRLISNFPIEFKLNRFNGKTEYIKAEDLDIYKLLCFDADYKDCLILIDEAPDIISHMASQTWKNRLIQVFVRQLRKNHNSLFLGAQDFSIIDKSMRWQTDILANCSDASRKYGWHSSERGKTILMRLLDNSGVWTGRTYHEYFNPTNLILYPRVLWGEKGKTKPVYDTFYIQDVWNSLRKVDMRMSSIEVGDKANQGLHEKYPVTALTLQSALTQIKIVSVESKDNPALYQKGFFLGLGSLTDQDKYNLGRILSQFNVERGGDGTKRWYDFSSFDLKGFQAYVEDKKEITEKA